MTAPHRRDLVLSLHPFSRGLAFTLFESPLSPIDWGVKDVRGKQRNALALEVARHLIDRFQPDILVLEVPPGPRSGRTDRIHRLQRLIASHAEGQAIEVRLYSRQHIRDCFKAVGAVTRYEIAQSIASRIDAFAHQLPPARKIWMSEDRRMGLFTAASLVMTFYCTDGGSGPTC